MNFIIITLLESASLVINIFFFLLFEEFSLIIRQIFFFNNWDGIELRALVRLYTNYYYITLHYSLILGYAQLGLGLAHQNTAFFEFF